MVHYSQNIRGHNAMGGDRLVADVFENALDRFDLSFNKMQINARQLDLLVMQ